MFYGCTSLNYINVNFTDWNSSDHSTEYWVKNVASTGTFVCPAELDISTIGTSNVPSGWRILDTNGQCRVHLWSNGVCSNCGEVCSHSWSNGSCTICGVECSHNWEDSSTTLAATPDADGLYGYGCTRCGASDGIHHVIKDFNGEGNNLELTLQDDNTYKAESMTLTDGQPFQSPVAFTVGTANYNRTMPNQWGTLCLPISLTVSAEDNAYDFYTLTSINGDELTIEKVANGTLTEGTPVIVHRNTAESGITISETNASVCTTPVEGSTAGDLTLTGTYTTEDITNQNGYFISNNAFWSIEDDRKVKVAPFRAWIKGTTANNARQLSLRFDDDDITAIDMLNASDDSETAAIYDLQGHRLSDLRQGVNIVKFSNGQTKKIIIK